MCSIFEHLYLHTLKFRLLIISAQSHIYANIEFNTPTM
jgi:hypothetical protein